MCWKELTQTKLKDKVSSKLVLQKANLSCVNEMVASSSAMMAWKSKRFMDPLGHRLFSVQKKSSNVIQTRSLQSDKIKIPVPGIVTPEPNEYPSVYVFDTAFPSLSIIE